MTALTPELRVLANTEALRDHLDQLNEAGVDFMTSGMDARGASFLAFLEGPYVESVGVLIHNPWDGEVDVTDAARHCDDCAAQGPIPAESLSYPVTVLARAEVQS